MKPLAKQLYLFLSACGGNWRNTIFVSCPESDLVPGFLMVAAALLSDCKRRYSGEGEYNWLPAHGSPTPPAPLKPA